MLMAPFSRRFYSFAYVFDYFASENQSLTYRGPAFTPMFFFCESAEMFMYFQQQK